MKEDDGIQHFMSCCCHDYILFFSDRGVAYSLRAFQVPEGSRTSQGTPMVQMLPIPKEEKITSVIAVQAFTDDEYLIMLTQKGYIKKTALSAFSNIRANGLIAISLEEGDQLRWVRRARSSDSVLIGSRQGMTIHFKADGEQLRPLGRPTRGVKSMNLRENDEVISMDILPSGVTDAIATASEGDDSEEDSEEIVTNSQGPWVLVITAGGMGKRVPVERFRLQKRAGMGLKALKFRLEEDTLVALRVVNEDQELMLVTSRGIIIRQRVNDISIQSRSAQGVRLQRLDSDDAIAAIAVVPTILSDEEDAKPTTEAIAIDAAISPEASDSEE
jgi:DNA gyrase subunit A